MWLILMMSAWLTLSPVDTPPDSLTVLAPWPRPTVISTDSGSVYLFTRAQAESLACARIECEELAARFPASIEDRGMDCAQQGWRRQFLTHAVAFVVGVIAWEAVR